MSTGTWRWAPVLLPSVAEPKPITWSTGQEGYSHCFWCWKELTIGDWLWGCADCHSRNYSCAGAFRRGQGEPVLHIIDLIEVCPPDRSIWTPADDVVPQ